MSYDYDTVRYSSRPELSNCHSAGNSRRAILYRRRRGESPPQDMSLSLSLFPSMAETVLLLLLKLSLVNPRTVEVLTVRVASKGRKGGGAVKVGRSQFCSSSW